MLPIKTLVDCISSTIYLLLVNEYIYMNKYIYIHPCFISETTSPLNNFCSPLCPPSSSNPLVVTPMATGGTSSRVEAQQREVKQQKKMVW